MLRDAAALEIEQKSGALEALGPIAKEPRARERLEVEVREAEEAVEKARDHEAAARARVEQNPVDAEQVAGEAERLARWREQLASLQRRGRIYQLALDAIVEAEISTMRTATHYLEKRMRATWSASPAAGTGASGSTTRRWTSPSTRRSGAAGCGWRS